MIVIGIDDTDVAGSPGTNQLARAIVTHLGRAARGAIVIRHQLFFDPRVPYTSQNGSASIQLPHGTDLPRQALLEVVRDVIRGWYVDGSDPGLAVTERASPEIHAFAARAKTDIVTQEEARAVAAQSGCYLEGLGGTNQGVIGALAAVALACGGDDGRVVHVDGWPWPDALAGVQSVSVVRERGVAEIRMTSGLPFVGDVVDVGKHLRPSWRGGRIVLLVDPPERPGAVPRAAKLK